MNVSSNIYNMHHIQELFLTLMTWWFQHTELFQNEVMPLLHGTLQLIKSYIKVLNYLYIKSLLLYYVLAGCGTIGNH